MGKHCDLGHILKPGEQPRRASTIPSTSEERAVLELDLEVQPNTNTHVVVPGRYHLDIIIAAANAKPVTRAVAINLTGDWYHDESRMFADGIGISIK